MGLKISSAVNCFVSSALSRTPVDGVTHLNDFQQIGYGSTSTVVEYLFLLNTVSVQYFVNRVAFDTEDLPTNCYLHCCFNSYYTSVTLI